MVYCHRPNCYWLSLDNLTDLQGVPPLHPNPEISGIGVILGFSITAYLTLALLILHYLTVYDPCRKVAKGQFYVNEIDRGLLAFVRGRVTAWTPTRRFEYAMEKSVLILSDTQVVTGLAILTAGYSQLECGITAYHWQIMVFVSWFSSFTFLAAMTFLEDYFQTNNKLRIIRLFFMFILSSLLVVALLLTGSQNWLDLLNEGGGFYPSLSALCYYQQITMESFTDGGPRLWSMVFSILVVGLSYIHGGIRLFDPKAEFTRRYFRKMPGTYLKRIVNFLDHKSKQRGIRAAPWILPLLLAYSTFVIARSSYDIAESMLLEIIWLAFAIAWGTIKIWDTRKITGYNAKGNYTGANVEVLDENSWSFGQTLPLVLLLLPLLSMAQAYLDNDAKVQDRLKTTPEL
ncbi:hypothetical protein BS50DRAFT_632753 [Corynespora cassiicola Philippines]|uniref:Uncharacterized protein n=1 Tax=Corynespora cassiicola Philippines TaxID=1448308 RepID=A0A2T2NU62_CORCC|nr:hypothetical protein BS50DRAFT_632753 [Corynespora cassiicola Philippines]